MKKNNWFITLNKEKDKDIFYTEEDILSLLQKYDFFGILHYKENNPHYHLYVYNVNGIRFSTLKNIFPTAHIEECFGNRKQVYDYLQHNGVDKEHYFENEIFTNVSNLNDFIMVSREIDPSSMYLDIIDMFCNGSSIVDVLRAYPHLSLKVSMLRSLREECICDLIDSELNNKV